MENKLKIGKVLPVIKKAIENPLLHLPFAGNMISVMKPAMQKYGINAYPIICLIGPPQSGKSTVASTIVIDRNDSIFESSNNDIEKKSLYIITDINVSNLKKILQKRSNDYIVLDDFALFHDSDTKRKANRFLDEVVRPSYAGTSALLLLTAESGALDKITDSLHDRMIKLYMGDWKYDPDNKQILENLFLIRTELSSLLQEFANWYPMQNTDIRAEYQDFHKIFNGKMDDRSISLFFTFDFSMREFSRFLTEQYGASFSIPVFRTSYTNIWKQNHLRSMNNATLIKYLFDKLLEEGAFECKIPRSKQLCGNYCSGACSIDDICCCHGDAANCNQYENACIDGNYYDPYELLMENTANSAILITNSDHICGMPAYKKLSVPLFVVEKNNLINMLNDALEKFCIEAGISHSSFGPKEISSLLNENKMCVQRTSGNHLVCTFPYMMKDQDKSSVYILRITSKEYKIICNKNQKKDKTLFSVRTYMPLLYETYYMMPQKLVQLCKDLHWRYESTDSYTKEKYTDIRP